MKRMRIRYHDPYNVGRKRWTISLIGHDGNNVGRPFFVGSAKTTLDDICNYLTQRRLRLENKAIRN